MTSSIAAVIPYFQREEGILRRSVLSALRQRDVGSFPIVVVDDGSPVPAHRELTDLMSQHPDRIKILRQPNAGPGAARNTALDALCGATQFIAFLDSDDQWTEIHLSNALDALRSGLDFYFCDQRLEQSTKTEFNEIGFEHDKHTRISDTNHLCRFSGDFFDTLILKPSCVGSTSGVVYRAEIFPDIRFDARFRRANEDTLFWLTLSLRTNDVGFSTRCEVILGRGVNIYRSAGWGSAGAIDRICDNIEFYKSVVSLFPLTGVQGHHVKSEIRKLRDDVVRNIVHRAMHGEYINGSAVYRSLWLEPVIFARFIPVCAAIMLDRAFRAGKRA